MTTHTHLIKVLFVLLFSSLFISSCGNGTGLELTLTSPESDIVFSTGAVVDILISGTATDDVEVSSVNIKNDLSFDKTLIGNGTETFSFSYESTNLIVNVDTSLTYTITAVDNEGNTVSELRTISWQ